MITPLRGFPVINTNFVKTSKNKCTNLPLATLSKKTKYLLGRSWVRFLSGTQIFLCPKLVSCWLINLSHRSNCYRSISSSQILTLFLFGAFLKFHHVNLRNWTCNIVRFATFLKCFMLMPDKCPGVGGWGGGGWRSHLHLHLHLLVDKILWDIILFDIRSGNVTPDFAIGQFLLWL